MVIAYIFAPLSFDLSIFLNLIDFHPAIFINIDFPSNSPIIHLILDTMIFTILISLPFALIAGISILGYLIMSAVIYTGYSIYRQPLYLPLLAAIVYSFYTSQVPATFVRLYFPSVYKTIH